MNDYDRFLINAEMRMQRDGALASMDTACRERDALAIRLRDLDALCEQQTRTIAIWTDALGVLRRSDVEPDTAVIDCPVKCEGCNVVLPMAAALHTEDPVYLCGKCGFIAVGHTERAAKDAAESREHALGVQVEALKERLGLMDEVVEAARSCEQPLVALVEMAEDEGDGEVLTELRETLAALDAVPGDALADMSKNPAEMDALATCRQDFHVGVFCRGCGRVVGPEGCYEHGLGDQAEHVQSVDMEDVHRIVAKQRDLLRRATMAVRGPEPDLTMWGHHDLPERCAALMTQVESMRAIVDAAEAWRKTYWSTPDGGLNERIALSDAVDAYRKLKEKT